MAGENNPSTVVRTPGLPGKATPSGTASIGVSLPGTNLTVLVQTANGGPINNVEVEVTNLRKQSTPANSNKITYTILNSEYDEKVATQNNKVNIKVRKAHFGPAPTSGTAVTPGEASGDFDFTKGTSCSVVLMLQDAAIGRYTDTYDSIPTRALTLRQARDALLCLHSQGNIRLIPEPTFTHGSGTVCDATNCKVAHPLVGELVGMSSKVGGIDYKYVGMIPESNDGVPAAAAAGDFGQLDVRNAVGLWRLAQLLQNSYFASTIYHSGISGGGVDKSGNPRIDCHGQGRAIDFDGAGGTNGIVTVYNDWGKMQVFDLSDPQTDLSLKKRLPPRQGWPNGDRTLMYRLDPLPPGGRDLARKIFQAVYTFAVTEYQDKSATATQTGPPSVIGEGGRVMNCDHYDSDPGGPNGREAHNGHMHMQIGETGTEPAPTIEPEP